MSASQQPFGMSHSVADTNLKTVFDERFGGEDVTDLPLSLTIDWSCSCGCSIGCGCNSCGCGC